MATTWPWIESTRNGVEGWEWVGNIFISKDYNPETGVAYMFIAPPEGRASIPAIAQGAPGLPITIRNTSVTELDWDDPTPADVTFTQVTPGSATVQPVYDVAFLLHGGAPGDTSSFEFLDADDLTGTPTAGYFPAYTPTGNSGGPGVIWTPQKVGGVYWPSSIASTTSGDGALRTLTYVTIPAQLSDWRPRVFGQTILTGSGPDCSVDLIARINDATSGDIVARRFGLPLTAPRDPSFIPGPAAGASASLGKIAAGAGPTTVYFRTERQTGADSYTTSASTTSFYVEVAPLP